MKKFSIILALVLLGALPDLSMAAMRYVRAGAAGNGSGSDWANAYASLPSTLARGDTYYVADGSYSSYTFDDAQNGAWIYIKKATAADHGTSTGWQSAYGDGVAVFGPLKFMTGSYEMDGQVGGGPGSWTSGHGFKIQYTAATNIVRLINVPTKVSNLTFKHMEMAFTPCSTCTGQDVFYGIYGGSNWKFQYNWMHHPSRVVLYTMNEATNILIEYTLLERSGTNGSSSQHSEIWSARDTHDVTFRYNYVRDYRSTGGIIMGRAKNWNLYGNIFQWTVDFGPTSNNGAIGSWSSDSTYYANNVKIYNNTFVGLRSGGAGRIFPIAVSLSGIVAQNNLWYDSPATAFGGGVSHSNNWFKNSNEGSISETGKQVGSGDPFVNYAGKDFRLKVATVAGTSLSAPFNLDIIGIARGSDGTWDRGAFEYGGTAAAGTTPSAPKGLTVN